MSPSLPNNIHSPADLQALILEIEAYRRWFMAASLKKRVSATAVVVQPPALSPASIDLIGQIQRKQQLNIEGLEVLAASLKSLEKSSPHITITLAAPPPMGLQKTIIAWCREQLAPNVLVSFKFNATLLGGMVVQSGSHVFDWSLRRNILANRQKFPEVLRHV
jgi:ATP synthase delta (OSCP) subunit